MKKTLSSALAVSAFSLLTLGQANAQELKSLELISGKISLDALAELNINFVPTGDTVWCGMTVDWGNGDKQDVRLGDDNLKSSPAMLSHKYSAAGTYTIMAQGRLLIRGLKTAASCGGNPRPTIVTVVDQAALAAAERQRVALEEAERAKAEAVARDRAFAERELELKRKELEMKEDMLRREEEMRKRALATPAPAPAPAAAPRPAPVAPAAPAAPLTPKAVKPADAF